tara:strand:- start:1477 stop:1914 length:438 start_codon:yes stop_codon:yes gene_type:complete
MSNFRLCKADDQEEYVSNISSKLSKMKISKFFEIANVCSIDKQRYFGIIRGYKYYYTTLFDVKYNGVRSSPACDNVPATPDSVLLNLRVSTFAELVDRGLNVPMKNYAGQPLNVTDSYNARVKILAEWNQLVDKVSALTEKGVAA